MASGGLTLNRHFGMGFLWAGGTVPEFRGRGIYTALVAARAQLAREQGLSHVGLYAIVDTSSPIVAHLGFERLSGAMHWGRVSSRQGLSCGARSEPSSVACNP